MSIVLSYLYSYKLGMVIGLCDHFTPCQGVLYRPTGSGHIFGLDWRTIFQVALPSFDTDTLTKDTLRGSLGTEPVSWLWFADPQVLSTTLAPW